MALSVGTVTANITGDPSGFNRALDGVRARGQKFARQMGRRMQRVGSSMTRSLTLPLAAAGAAIFKLGGDFESQMSKITGLVGVSEEQVDSWKSSIRDMAADVGRGPGELAEAMFFVTSAGFRGAEAMDVLEVSARAASAGLGETKQIADLVTSSINAYGQENLTAVEATDTLTAAVREGKLEAETLAPVLGQVLPIASNLAIGFDEVAGFMAAMSRTGLDAARGATALRSVMNALVKPTAQAEKQLEAVGLSVAELREQAGEQGIVPVLMSLRDAFGDNQEAMANVFPNVRALTGVLNVLGQDADTVTGIMNGVADSAGSVDRAFDSAADTGTFALNAMLAEAQSLAGDLYDSMKTSLIPVFQSVQQGIRDFRNTWQGFSEEARRAVFVVAGLLGAAGPIIAAIGTLSLAIGAISAPIAGVVAAIAAGATAIISNWDDVTSFFTEGQGARMWTTFKELVDETIITITELWDSFGDDFLEVSRDKIKFGIDLIERSLRGLVKVMKKFNGNFNAELKIWEDSWTTTLDKIDGLIVSTVIKSMERLVRALSWVGRKSYQVFLEPWVELLSIVEEDTASKMKNVADIFNDSVDSFLNFIGVADAGPWTDVFGQIEQAATSAGNAVSNATGGGNAVSNATGGGGEQEQAFSVTGVESAQSSLIGLQSTISSVSSSYMDGLSSMTASGAQFSSVTDAALISMGERWQSFKDNVVNVSEQVKTMAVQQIQNAVLNFGEIIGKKLAGVQNTFSTTFEKIVLIMLDFASSLVKLAAGIGSLMLFIPGMQGVGAGILAASAGLQATISGVESGIQKRIRNREERSNMGNQSMGTMTNRTQAQGNKKTMTDAFDTALSRHTRKLGPREVFVLSQEGKRGY